MTVRPERRPVGPESKGRADQCFDFACCRKLRSARTDIWSYAQHERIYVALHQGNWGLGFLRIPDDLNAQPIDDRSP